MAVVILGMRIQLAVGQIDFGSFWLFIYRDSMNSANHQSQPTVGCFTATHSSQPFRPAFTSWPPAAADFLVLADLQHQPARVVWRQCIPPPCAVVSQLEQIMGTLDRLIYAFIQVNNPFAVLAMTGTLPIILLSVLWGAVLMGAIINVFWLDAPRWIHSLLYLAVSWAGVVAVPQLWDNLGLTALAWILVGGILYSIGGIVYAVQRPDPLPKVFGFHEVFHVFVTVAVAIHYGVIAQYLIPI